MKKGFLALIVMGLLVIVLPLVAQDDGPTSNVGIFYVACDVQGVIELSGEMQPGYDVYFQMFSGADGTGVPVSGMRRVTVNGTYTFSEVVAYSDGITLAAGGVGSAYVAIARESDSSRTIYETYVNDLQDGCAEPSLPPGTSSNINTPTTVDANGTPTFTTTGVLTPFGGELNAFADEALVEIGARRPAGRTSNPGLVFAECDQYPQANPGILYDTDEINIFWSWYAKTPALVQEHIDHAYYDVKLNGEIFPEINISEITQARGDYWVFYVAPLGASWRPNSYVVDFQLNWDQAISDGYDEFGPGTAHPSQHSTCSFNIYPNPYNIMVNFPDDPVTIPLGFSPTPLPSPTPTITPAP